MKKISFYGRETIVDDETYKWASKWKWRYDGQGYAYYRIRRNKKYYYVKLHSLVIGPPPKGYVTDHINGDTLDNRSSNLRHVDFRTNMHNTKKHRAGHILGTTMRKDCRRWQAQAKIGDKTKYLGLFKTKEDANMAFLAYVRTLPLVDGEMK
jgi:hypothetical protein